MLKILIFFMLFFPFCVELCCNNGHCTLFNNKCQAKHTKKEEYGKNAKNDSVTDCIEKKVTL